MTGQIGGTATATAVATDGAVDAALSALAIDSTSDCLSLAVMKDGVPAASQYEDIGRRTTQEILPRIDALLKGAGLDARALDLLLVARGPGSFTGTRIGLAVAITFAQLTGRPLIGVDSLHLLAAQTDPAEQRRFVVLLNCARDEVYHAAFRWRAGRLAMEGQIALSSLAGLLPELGQTPVVLRRFNPGLATTAETEAAFARLTILPLRHAHPDAVRLLALGVPQYLEAPQRTWPRVTPIYLKSEAFRKWRPAR